MTYVVKELDLEQDSSIQAGDGNEFQVSCVSSSSHYPSLRVRIGEQDLLMKNFVLYSSVLQSSQAPDRLLFFSSLGACLLTSNGETVFKIPMAPSDADYMREWGDPEIVYLEDFVAIVAPQAVCVVDRKLDLVAMMTKYIDDNFDKTIGNVMHFINAYNENSWSLDAGVSYLVRAK
jgi:hypothetical protein